MTRRLVVCDQYEGRWLEKAKGAAQPGDDWDVLLLDLSETSFRKRFSSRLPALRSWRVVDLVPISAWAHQLVGDWVLDFARRLPDTDLGGLTLAELLNSAEGNQWWYLQTAEKNPLRDPLVGMLYHLALVRLTVESGDYDELWLSLGCAPVRRVIAASAASLPAIAVDDTPDRRPIWWWDAFPLVRYWVHALATVWSFLLTRLVMALSGWPRPQPSPDGLFFFSIYPYWWLAAYGPEAKDRFFAALPEAMPAQYLSWLVWPGKLWRRRRQVGDLIGARGLVVLQRFVGLVDAMRLLFPAIFRRTLRFERRMRPLVTADFLGFEVGPLVASDVSRSLTGSELFLDRLVCRACRNFASSVSGRALVYRLEFQPLEHALLLGSRGAMRSVGFLHSPFGRNFLPMRFAPGELAEAAAARRPHRDRPLPDAVLVCGSGGLTRLEKEGFPEGRAATCGPQRHRSLLEYRKKGESRDARRTRLGLPLGSCVVFVALAMIEAETQALFDALTEALADWSDSLVLVKTHPNKPGGDAATRAALSELGHERASLVPVEGDMYDYIAAADAMCCVGSTVAFDAMALGVMPIVFENPGTFAGTSLAAYNRGLYVARNAAEIRAALGELRSGSSRSDEKRRQWPAMLEEVFGDMERPLVSQLESALERLGVAGRAANLSARQ